MQFEITQVHNRRTNNTKRKPYRENTTLKSNYRLSWVSLIGLRTTRPRIIDYAAIWDEPNSQEALFQKGLIFHFR